MSPFLLQDHTADVRLNVTGRDQTELFKSALEGLVSVLAPDPTVANPRESVSFSTESPHTASLLVDFLNEALCLMQTRKATIIGVDFTSLDDSRAKGRFLVTRVNGFAEDVKAVTYHDMHVLSRPEGSLETTIVLDV